MYQKDAYGNWTLAQEIVEVNTESHEYLWVSVGMDKLYYSMAITVS